MPWEIVCLVIGKIILASTLLLHVGLNHISLHVLLLFSSLLYSQDIMKALLILFLVSFLTTTFVLKIYYPVGHVFFRGQFIYSKSNISGANFGNIWWIAGVNYKK